MKNLTDFLKQAVDFQELASNRGYELMMALGCKLTMCRTPYHFQFGVDEVVMAFQENTRHDCPEDELICLKLEELEKTDEEWASYIEQTKRETSDKEQKKRQDDEDRNLQSKKEQFENLKKELGY